MEAHKKSKVDWRTITAIIAGTVLVFSTISTTAYTAAFAEKDDDKAKDKVKEVKDQNNDGNVVGNDDDQNGREAAVSLRALPKTSLIDDGNSEILKLKFKLNTGNFIDEIKVTIDQGTPEEKVLEFSADGEILNADPAYVLVFGSTKLVTDGYAVGPAHGKFIIAVDKSQLTEGTHTVTAEVILDVGTLTAQDDFTLKASKPHLPDLATDHFFAPKIVMAGKQYTTFTIEENKGMGEAGEHDVKVFLSKNNAIDGEDKALGNTSVKALHAGDFELVPVQISVPQNTHSDMQFLIVKLDASDKIQETNEDNNVVAKQAMIVGS